MYKIAANEVFDNGYYPEIVKIYIGALRLFVIKGALEFAEGKRICEELLIDYGGDFEHNYEIYEEYRDFIQINSITDEQKERQTRSLFQRQLKARSADLDLVFQSYENWESKENMKKPCTMAFEENKKTQKVYAEFYEKAESCDSESKAVEVLNELRSQEKFSIAFSFCLYEKLCSEFGKSEKIWEAYIDFLETQPNNCRILSVYRRMARNLLSYEIS